MALAIGCGASFVVVGAARAVLSPGGAAIESIVFQFDGKEGGAGVATGRRVRRRLGLRRLLSKMDLVKRSVDTRPTGVDGSKDAGTGSECAGRCRL